MKSLLRGGALIGAATALVLMPASLAAAQIRSSPPAQPGWGTSPPYSFKPTTRPAIR